MKSYRQQTEQIYSVAAVTLGTEGQHTTDVTQIAGARPLVEQIQAETQSQELRATVRDEVRIGLNGELETQLHNEFCETPDELDTIALGALREYSALPVTLDITVEGRIHKDDAIVLDMAEAGFDSLTLHVTNVVRRFGVGGFRETITAAYYPPEVLS